MPDTTHADTVARHNLGACNIEANAEWPYDCEAKERNPNHIVFVCHTHGAWWHQSPPFPTLAHEKAHNATGLPRCIHTPARCNGGGYDGCACGPLITGRN